MVICIIVILKSRKIFINNIQNTFYTKYVLSWNDFNISVYLYFSTSNKFKCINFGFNVDVTKIPEKNFESQG